MRSIEALLESLQNVIQNQISRVCAEKDVVKNISFKRRKHYDNINNVYCFEYYVYITKCMPTD